MSLSTQSHIGADNEPAHRNSASNIHHSLTYQPPCPSTSLRSSRPTKTTSTTSIPGNYWDKPEADVADVAARWKAAETTDKIAIGNTLMRELFVHSDAK